MPPVKLEDCFPVGCGRMYEVAPTHELPARDFPCDAEGLCPDCARRLRILMGLNLRQLLDIQVQYHHEHAIFDGDDWVRHAHLHLDKLTGKMADYLRQIDHGDRPSRDELEQEVVPDLLFWFLEVMIGLQMTDPAKAYGMRITANIKRDEQRARAAQAAKEPPMCMNCGIQMLRAGSIFACPSCGNSSEGI